MSARYDKPNNEEDADKHADQSPWWNLVSREEEFSAPQQNEVACNLEDEAVSVKKIVGIVLAVVVTIAIIGCGAAFALSSAPQKEEDAGITQEDEEAAKQASMAYLTVYADGADGNTSSCSVKVLKGENGDDAVSATTCRVGERTSVGMLQPGTYRVHVDNVPSNADGSTYLAPLFDLSFDVVGDGQDMDLTLNLDKATDDNQQDDGNDAAAAEQQPAESGDTSTATVEQVPAEVPAAASSGNAQSGTSVGSQSHQHNWVAQTTTKHHDAVYRTVNHAAQKERRTICDACGQDITNNFGTHRSQSGHSSYHYEYKVIKEAYSENVLVSDAYDETVTTGYKCSICGATR